MEVEFTGAQLFKGTVVEIEYIQHWHNGKSLFEFVPEDGAQYSLSVYRNFAEGQQTSKKFELSLKIDPSKTIIMNLVNVKKTSDEDISNVI